MNHMVMYDKRGFGQAVFRLDELSGGSCGRIDVAATAGNERLKDGLRMGLEWNEEVVAANRFEL